MSNGDDGSVACDHYHRYAADVALMAELGIQSYRFSTAWARIRPDGGPVNPAGLDFYSRLVDELLEHDILPWLTSIAGTCRRRSRNRAAGVTGTPRTGSRDYALDLHAPLGDRVPVWTTLNEPWCTAFVGHVAGAHAPGMQDPAAGLAVMHHVLLGHGLAVQALRSAQPDLTVDLTVDLTLNLTVAVSADPSRSEDVDAAGRIDGQFNRIFLDPIFRGECPADVTAMGWEIQPDGLRALLVRVHSDYADPAGVDLHVTENGVAFDDVVAPDGSVSDPDRTAFLAAHLNAVLDAIDAGVPLRGYFYWSLMANFEWAWGYAKRFGTVRVDYATQ